MKYLNRYQIFESVDDSLINDEIKKDVEDICLELFECGVDYSTYKCKYYKDEPFIYDCLCIDIKSIDEDFFKLEDIMDVMLRLVNYIKDFKGYSIDFCVPSEDSYLEIDDFIELYESEEMYKIEIYVYKLNKLK